MNKKPRRPRFQKKTRNSYQAMVDRTSGENHKQGCSGKTRYTKSQGEIVATRLTGEGKFKVVAYACRHGNHWHVGRERKRLPNGITMIVRNGD